MPTGKRGRESRMRVLTAFLIGAVALTLAALPAAGQHPTSIRYWPAHYTDGPFIFAVHFTDETRDHKCMPPLDELARASDEQMKAHELEETDAIEKARLVFMSRIIVSSVAGACVVAINSFVVADIQTKTGHTLTVDGGDNPMAVMSGEKEDTDRMAIQTVRDFVGGTAREILMARLRQKEAREQAIEIVEGWEAERRRMAEEGQR